MQFASRLTWVTVCLLLAAFAVSTSSAGRLKTRGAVEQAISEPSDDKAPDVWNIASPEGGSDKTTPWRKEKGGGPFAWCAGILFVILVGSLPLSLHFGRQLPAGRHRTLTKTTICESVALYIWLIGGLYLFTNVLLFQSPHFNEVRSLSLEESVYLFSQILTTVGYGDITPAKVRGQVFIGLFVFLAVMLIANMISELMGIFEERMDIVLGIVSPGSTPRRPSHNKMSEEEKVTAAFKPVIYSSIVFLSFVVAGTCFFHFYPGENKTIGQGIYMAFITLSSVGFGAFTPTTHAGMVFGAFWMIFGVGALGGVITSYSAFSKAMKHYETLVAVGEDDTLDSARMGGRRKMGVHLDASDGHHHHG